MVAADENLMFVRQVAEPVEEIESFLLGTKGQRIFPVGGGVIKNIVLSLHHGTYKTTSRDPTGRTNRQL